MTPMNPNVSQYAANPACRAAHRLPAPRKFPTRMVAAAAMPLAAI